MNGGSEIMKKIWKKLISVTLIIMIAFASMSPCFVSAEELLGDFLGENPAISENEGDVQTPILGDEAPQDEPAYIDIDVSQRIISFGHVSKGSPAPYQALTVTSLSSETIYLDYQLCDAEDIFYISTRDSLSIAPGQSITIYIGVDENRREGYYTANLILCPAGHVQATVNVGISAEIIEDTPYITYICVKPASVDMNKNSSYQFAVDIRGENNPDCRVEWNVQGNTSSGTTIDSNGYLKVGQNETASQLYVTATSVIDREMSHTALVKIQEGNYSVNTSSNPNNGGTTGGSGIYAPKSNIEVYAAPNNGFRFTNWTRDGRVVSSNPKYTINNIHENYNLVANFEQVNSYVKVNAIHPEGGTVSQSGNVNYNGSFDLVATPKPGFVFEGWYEGGKRISDKGQLTINNIVNNREFTANFVQNIFKVQLQVNPQGTGVVAGEGSFTKGSKVTVIAKAIDGYDFDCWTSNGILVSQNANFTFSNIDKDYVLVANFKKKAAVTYVLNSKVDEGQGTVTPNGAASVPEGVDVTYTFAPAKNYTISSVTVDGKNIGAVPSYTFKKINGNHTVGVKFAKIPDTVIHVEKKEDKPDKQQEILTDNSKVEVTKVIDTEEEYKPDNVEDETISSFLEYTELTGILQEYNITEEEARSLIRNKLDISLLERACEEQYLAVSVTNEYADNKQETESTSYMSLSSTPNFEEVIDSILTEDEKINIFKGAETRINFNLFANNKLENDENKKLVNQAIKDKVEIGNFFEAVLIKSGDEGDQMITKIDVPMQIVLNIPQNLKADGREFFVMRSHKNEDGTISIDYLPNESSDQSKIVFTTDKFSTYAIAYKGGKSVGLTQSDLIKILFVASMLAIIVTIVLVILLIRMKRQSKKKKIVKNSRQTF